MASSATLPPNGGPFQAPPVPNGSASGPEASKKAAKPTEPPKYNFHIDQLAEYAFYAFLVWLLLLWRIFRPSLWTLLWYLVWGTAAGAGATFLYFKRLQSKAQINQVLSFDPGLKGLKFLCGELPSWLSLTEREKVEWLNSMLSELWPFYDKAVCDTVKEMVEPMMEMYKPTGVLKSISFKNLTFGTAPFRIEDMLVVEENADEVLLEVNIRWAGDANITLAVDLPAGGDFTRMCPKITDMSFMGTARISLRPLIDTIPCFGFAMVSFRKPPLIKYKLDFGKAFGGSGPANAIKGFIEPFIEDILLNMLVWPNRILVPIVMTEDSAMEMEKLQLRDVGVMRVRLSKAKDLKAYDMNGKSDPTVTLWIDPLHKRNSKVVKSTLNPDFGDETFYLLVQEPKDQYLRLEMFDVDFFNAEKLASSWKVWQGVSKAFNAKTHMGRCMINVKHICDKEGVEVERWYPLGKGEWGDDDGPGKGEGEIQMKCCYQSFNSLSSILVNRIVAEQKNKDLSKEPLKGVLIVKVYQCSHVEVPKGQDWLSVHLIFKCNKEEFKSNPVRAMGNKEADGSFEGPSASGGLGGSSGSAQLRSMASLTNIKKKDQLFCNPVFNVKHAFHDVDVNSSSMVKLKLMTAGGTLGGDEELGRFEIHCQDIKASRFHNQQGRANRNVVLQDTSTPCAMHFDIVFIPYFSTV